MNIYLIDGEAMEGLQKILDMTFKYSDEAGQENLAQAVRLLETIKQNSIKIKSNASEQVAEFGMGKVNSNPDQLKNKELILKKA